MNEPNESRWLRGQYNSAADAGRALAHFLDRTDADADFGIDYERLAEAVLNPTTGNSGGDYLTLMRSRRDQLLSAYLRSERRAEGIAVIWWLRRVAGKSAGAIASSRSVGEHKIERQIADFDILFDEAIR